MTRGLSVDGARLRADLETLGRIGAVPGGGVSRTSFSPADAQAREWYRGRCALAGLTVQVDGIGNMFVSRPGEPAAGDAVAAVWSGSHLDSVPGGGRFDGALGAVAALECVRRLSEEGVALRRPVRAVVYSDEEGNYSHLFGSSALARGFTAAQLQELTGRDGDRFVDTFVAAGVGPGGGDADEGGSAHRPRDCRTAHRAGAAVGADRPPDRDRHGDRGSGRRHGHLPGPPGPRRHDTDDDAQGRPGRGQRVDRPVSGDRPVGERSGGAHRRDHFRRTGRRQRRSGQGSAERRLPRPGAGERRPARPNDRRGGARGGDRAGA